MIAICLQLSHGIDSGHLPNPLWHPAIKVLRAPFFEYLGKHPERAAALLRQPRRISIPRHASKQQQTILNTFPMVNGRQWLDYCLKEGKRGEQKTGSTFHNPTEAHYPSSQSLTIPAASLRDWQLSFHADSLAAATKCKLLLLPT
jgi:hypothetical protein